MKQKKGAFDKKEVLKTRVITYAKRCNDIRFANYRFF